MVHTGPTETVTRETVERLIGEGGGVSDRDREKEIGIGTIGSVGQGLGTEGERIGRGQEEGIETA